VADLHALLAAAAVPGPYVLVGHSLGGLFVRLYAYTYPDEVAGMVLVDATHEDNFARLEELVGPELWAAFTDQFEQAVAQGVLEPVDLADLAAQVKAARSASPLRPMPLVVLSHTRAPDAGPLPDWPVAAEDRLWHELQDDLAGLVPNSRHVAAERSGHYIQQDRPDLVIAAIRDVVRAVRDPGSWAAPGP
jgi:pimeloyl-ACP methyl ester carboxylesterase